MPQEATTESPGLMQKLFTPEAFIMISFAVFIDAGEFFVEHIPFVGNFLSILLDIIALIFIGIWMYSRSRRIIVPEKTALRIKKAIKFAKRFKWLKPACMIFEMLPVISSLAPLWIVAVLLELSSD